MKPSTEASAGRRRVPNRRGEGGRLRDDIVRGASELIAETGDSSAVTLSAVARRVGIAAPSIYRHFPGPDAILLAVVEQEFARLHEDLNARVERAGEDPVARLLAMCGGYLDFARERPRRYLVMFGGVWNAAGAIQEAKVATDEVGELGMSSLRQLVSLLRASVDAGRSTSDDPETDAVALWTAMHGLAHQRIVSTAMIWPPDVEEKMVRRLAYLPDEQ